MVLQSVYLCLWVCGCVSACVRLFKKSRRNQSPIILKHTGHLKRIKGKQQRKIRAHLFKTTHFAKQTYYHVQHIISYVISSLHFGIFGSLPSNTVLLMGSLNRVFSKWLSHWLNLYGSLYVQSQFTSTKST